MVKIRKYRKILKILQLTDMANCSFVTSFITVAIKSWPTLITNAIIFTRIRSTSTKIKKKKSFRILIPDLLFLLSVANQNWSIIMACQPNWGYFIPRDYRVTFIFTSVVKLFYTSFFFFSLNSLLSIRNIFQTDLSLSWPGSNDNEQIFRHSPDL